MPFSRGPAGTPRGDRTGSPQKCQRPVSPAVVVPMGETGPAGARLGRAGLAVRVDQHGARISSVTFGSAAEKIGLAAGWGIVSVSVPADRPAKEWAFLPALLMLSGIWFLQGRRRVTSQ